MRGRTYNISGMGSQSLGDVQDNSTVHISGMGSVSINGTIGENVSVNHSGMGSFNINGTVKPSVKFNISGMGSVNFSKRPPQSVIDNMNHSGMGSLKIPGGYNPSSSSAAPTSSNFQINGGAVYGMGNGAVAYHHPSNNASTFVSHGNGNTIRSMTMNADGIRGVDGDGNAFFIPPNSGAVNIEEYLAKEKRRKANGILSPSTKSYLEELRNQVSLSDLYASLELNSEEAILFNDFRDPLTHKIMDEPVWLENIAYNLSSLENIPANENGERKYPDRGYHFSLSALRSARDLVKRFHQTIDKLDHDRQEKLEASKKLPAQVKEVVNEKILVQSAEIKKELLQQLTPAMRAYLDSFNDKQKHIEIVDAMKLSEQEEKLLQEYIDSKTLDVMNIPVSVNGHLYELQTLLDQPVDVGGLRQELIDDEKFYLRDIQPARYAVTAISNILKEIQEKRGMVAPAKQASNAAMFRPSAPPLESDVPIVSSVNNLFKI